MVDPDMEIRPSRLIRQIEEGIYNIKPEDYNEEGALKSPSELKAFEGFFVQGEVKAFDKVADDNINSNLFEEAKEIKED